MIDVQQLSSALFFEPVFEPVQFLKLIEANTPKATGAEPNTCLRPILRRKEPEIAASNLVERRADAKIRTFFSSVP